MVAAPVVMYPLLISFLELPVCLMGWPSYYPQALLTQLTDVLRGEVQTAASHGCHALTQKRRNQEGLQIFTKFFCSVHPFVPTFILKESTNNKRI